MSVNEQTKMKVVARRFIQQYYSKLFESPTAPLSLYSEESHFLHSHNLESGESVTGVQKISEFLAKLAYHGGSVDLHNGSFDIQPSANGGFILIVTGLFKCRADSEPSQFTQTFFLAKHPRGALNSLFVLNDCLRFISRPSQTEEHQTKAPEHVVEETKQSVSTPKQEIPETVEVQQPPQTQQPPQPEVVVPEKEPQVVETKTETVVNTVNTPQFEDGWGQPNEEDDDENDSDYVDDEEQDDDDDDDDDDELFDEHEAEHDTGSIDDLDHDEVSPRRVEGKWVPKKKPEESQQNKTDVETTVQPTVVPSELKKEELTQPQQHHHHHHHTHKQTPVSRDEQTESKPRAPLSYANIAGKNTSQPSNPVPTSAPKKKTTTAPVVAPQAPAPVTATATAKPTTPQTQPNLPNLYIGNLNEGVTEDLLKSTFESYGPIKKVNLKTGIAFIEFNDNSIVPNIINDGKQTPFNINGQTVKVDLTRPMTKNPNSGSVRGTGRGGGQFNNNNNNNTRQQNKTKK